MIQLGRWAGQRRKAWRWDTHVLNLVLNSIIITVFIGRVSVNKYDLQCNLLKREKVTVTIFIFLEVRRQPSTKYHFVYKWNPHSQNPHTLWLFDALFKKYYLAFRWRWKASPSSATQHRAVVMVWFLETHSPGRNPSSAVSLLYDLGSVTRGGHNSWRAWGQRSVLCPVCLRWSTKFSSFPACFLHLMDFLAVWKSFFTVNIYIWKISHLSCGSYRVVWIMLVQLAWALSTTSIICRGGWGMLVKKRRPAGGQSEDELDPRFQLHDFIYS